MTWLLLLFCSAAKAAPPFTVDDADTTAPHSITAYVDYSLDRASEAKQVDARPALAFTAGLTENTEIGAGIALVHEVAARGDARLGLGDTNVGLKHRFGRVGGFSWSGALQGVLPTGSRELEGYSGAASAGAGLIAQEEVAAWKFTGEVLAARLLRAGEKLSSLAGITASRAVGQGFLGAQIYSNGSSGLAQSFRNLVFGVGGGLQASKKLAFQAQVSEAVAGAKALYAYAGFTVDFSPEE